MVASSEIGWLEKVLAGHVASCFPGAEEPVAVETPLRAVLTSAQLSQDEQSALDEWEEGLHSHRSVGDLLLEARINAAVRQQAEALAQSMGIASVPEVPPVQVVRGSEEHGDGSMAASLTAAGVLQATDGGLSVSRLTGASTFLFTDGDGYDAIRKLSLDPNQTDFLEEGREARLAGAKKSLTIVQSMHGLGAVEDAIKQALPRYQELVDKTPAELEERDLTGEVLGGKYRVKRRLGKGGFGTVYEAVDEMLGAPVAIKVLNPKAAGHERALEQFLGEAKLLTNLDHPSIVRWITFDKRDDGQHYFVMEYLSGEELSEILKCEGRLAPERVLHMLLEIVDALRAAHRLPDGSSLYHLDLKPQNVFVVSGEPERIKVIDFGISQHVGAEAREAAGVAIMSASERPGQDLGATIASQVTPAVASDTTTGVQRARGGTLLYASPEQCKHLAGHPDIVALDGRSDLYSVGIMAFQMLTGEIPFAHLRTPMDAIEAHLRGVPRKPSDLEVDVPKKLASFVARCLAKDRDARFADAEEAYAALERIANPPSKWPWLSAAAGLVVLPTALWFAFQKPLEPFSIEDRDQLVYAGPEQRSVVLPLSGLEVEGTEVSFWSDITGGEELLTDWSAEVGNSGSGDILTVIAPEDLTEPVDAQVYVRLTGAGKMQSSRDPLRIVFLGEGAWTLQPPGVTGLLGKALDPVGAVLEIPVRAEESAIGKVEVSFEGKTLPASGRSTGANLDYTLELGQFGATTAGPATFEVTVTDQAGGRQTSPFPVQLEPDELRVETGFVEGSCVEIDPGVEYLINSSHAPVLFVRPNRKTGRPGIVVKKEGGTVLEIPVTDTNAEERFGLDFSALTEATSGTIEVTVGDLDTTYHAQPKRGEAVSILEFSYVSDLPRARLSSPSSNAPIVFEGTRGFVTKDPRFELRLDREDVQVQIEVVLSARPTGQELDRKPVNLFTADSDTVSFTLPADGVYDLEASLFRRGSTKAEENLERVVVLDRSPRTARLECPTGVVLTKETVAAWSVGLRLAEPENVVALPMEVNWELRCEEALVESGTLEELPPGEQALGWAQLGLVHDELEDGDYELTVTGTDAAGNALGVDSGPAAWEIARRPPELDFKRPVDGKDWEPVEYNTFRVVVDAHDPNGVAFVECRIAPAGGEESPVVLAASAGGAGDRWTAEGDLPPTWSGRRLGLEFTARDGQGIEDTTSIVVTAVEFKPRRPEIIALVRVDAPEADITRMRLVEGSTSYLLGGQGDRLEKKIFPEYGEEPQAFASWAHPLKIEPFYLDVDEVTVAQFLAFVQAFSGYRDASHWEVGSPDPGRQASLLAELSQRASDEPVTDVDAFEALAYAHWVGKRLPGLPEWEYAVRGGVKYRPASFSISGASAADAEINVDLELTRTGSAWPVTRGDDETPEGIRNLCSNVSEWTLWFEPPSGVHAPAGARAAGANYRSASYLFPVHTPQAQESRRPTLGFRCALSEKDFRDLVDQGEAAAVRLQKAGPR